jgi:hypothetical protein
MDGVAAWVFYRLHWRRALAMTTGTDFTSEEKKRLRHYWYGVCYLCSVFDRLRGRRLSRQEMLRITPAAALAAFFDDLSHQKSLVHAPTPEDFGRAADPRGRTLHWLQRVYLIAPDAQENALKETVGAVYEAEKLPEHSIEDMVYKSAEKGGRSVLLFRHLLDDVPDDKSRQALFQFGALLQLCDDILDIWFDNRDGIRTPATFFAEHQNLDGLVQLLESQIHQTRTAFLAADARRGLPAWAAVHFIVSITRVSLDRYTALSKKNGTLPLDNRRQMVTDMAQWPNRLRAARLLINRF